MTPSGPISRTVVVGHAPMGLHMRPAMAFAKMARTGTAKVVVRLGDKSADGQSPMELLMLFAPPGTELTLELEGEGAEDLMDKLAEILSSEAGEDDRPADP